MKITSDATWLRSILLAACLAMVLAGCGDKATVLFVNVTSKCNIKGLEILSVALTHEGLTTTGNLTGGAITLPTTFVIRADGRTGAAGVALTGYNSKNQVVALGKGSATLLPDKQVGLTVVLSPSDFQANTRHKGDQIFSLKGFGRQIAASKNGNFVVGWKDHTLSTTQHNIWSRLFDRNGTARLNYAGSTNEARINNSQSQYYDHLALAMQRGGGQDGHFVAAMAHKDSSSSVAKIRVRPFSSTGNPSPESTLQASGEASVPDIAAISGGGYVVVWQERDTTNGKWKVMAHLLDVMGKPSLSPTGGVAPFKVTEFAYTALSEPAPAVAAGGNGGFMVVWRENSSGAGRGNLKATAFASKKQNYKELKSRVTVANLQTGEVREFGISHHVIGYAVIWGDKVGYKPDNDGTCIRFRRFDYSGVPKEKEYTLNTEAPGNQDHPAVAMRDDGSLLAVWSTSHNATGDPLGGIRGRRILSNGLPTGNDISINTTTPKSQTYPAVAGQYGDAFVVAFMDRSGVGPDIEGTGIRARVICPDYRARDGLIGALCDADHPCGASLVCKDIQTGKRCVAQCTGSGGACHHGGVCQQDSATKAWMCLYP